MTYEPSNSITPRSSLSSVFRTASMPSTWITSMRWLDVVRVKSTSSWFITSRRLTPSVSSIHSLFFVNVSVTGSRPITFASRMNTFLMSAIPRSDRLVSICDSSFLRKTSSSVVDGPASLSPISLSSRRIRRMSLSELSSLNMHDRSSWKFWLMLSAMSAISSFLSTIISRFSSMRSSHGDIRLGSTSSSGIS